MLSPFLFAVVVDVVIEIAREDALSELLYADDLVFMSETIVVMVSPSITKDGMSKAMLIHVGSAA